MPSKQWREVLQPYCDLFGLSLLISHNILHLSRVREEITRILNNNINLLYRHKIDENGREIVPKPFDELVLQLIKVNFLLGPNIH